jgi:hypothetical protein
MGVSVSNWVVAGVEDMGFASGECARDIQTELEHIES